MNVGQWVGITIEFPQFVEHIQKACRKSLFDDPVMRRLKEWRVRFGLSVRFRCGGRQEELSLPDFAAKELGKKNWIAFADPAAKTHYDLAMEASDPLQTEEWIGRFSQYFYDRPKVKKVQLQIHPDILLKRPEELEAIWRAFDSVCIPVCVDSFLLIQDRLWFCACNVPWLFEYDLIGGILKARRSLPCTMSRKFSLLVQAQGALWLLPRYEDSVYRFCLAEGSLERFPMPKWKDAAEGDYIRNAVVQQDYAWMYLARSRRFLRFSFTTREFELFYEHPKGAPSLRMPDRSEEIVGISFPPYCSVNHARDQGEADFFVWNEKKYVIPYMGNLLLEAEDGKTGSARYLKIPLYQIDRTKLSRNRIYQENGLTTLEWFVQKVGQGQITE